MKFIIISVGVGAWYPRGLKRQEEKLREGGYSGAIQYWTDQYPAGSPTHQQTPYAFKAFAFEWALQRGYDAALWLDSSIYPQKSIQPLIDQIERTGYLIPLNGWTTGEWSTDEQLNAFGYTRDEAMQIPHAASGMIGMNFKHEKGMKLFDEFYRHYPIFKGAWTNKRGEVSRDRRVLGSRHDQTIISLIAHKYGYDFTPPQGLYTYDKTEPNHIFIAEGM